MALNNDEQILLRVGASQRGKILPRKEEEEDSFNNDDDLRQDDHFSIWRDEPLSTHDQTTNGEHLAPRSGKRAGRCLPDVVEPKEGMNFVEPRNKILLRNSSVPNSTTVDDRQKNWRGRRYSLVQALSNPLTRLLDDPAEPQTTHSSTLPVVAKDSPRRLSILNEIVNCEKDYVGLLVTLVESFLRPARRRADLFDEALIAEIFGNVESLMLTHQKFLADLQLSMSRQPICIGPAFLKHTHAFDIYSHFCNNHQRSCQRILSLYNSSELHAQFLDNCRIAGGLPPLRLDAFLLRPVQHLCRYPLLLSDLLRLTSRHHPDHCHCSSALQCAQNLLSTINSKRKYLEEMIDLVRWQRSVVGWHGSDILTTSCRLVHSGELSCACITKTGFQRWRKRSVVFLFDHLLIVCRKDRLKKQLLLKTRINLDEGALERIDEESWQLSSMCENKRFIFKAANRRTFVEWMDAFERERLFRTTLDEPGQAERQMALDSADLID